MQQTESSSSSRTLWIAVLFMVIFLFGSCVAGISGLLYWMNGDAPTPARPIVRNNSNVSRVSFATPLPQVIIATPESGFDYETATLMNIYAQVNPSVVNVAILQKGSNLQADPTSGIDKNDLLEVGGGSGFIWDMEGHIVTNQHVVEGADQVHVKFSDGTTTIAEVVGVDVDSDLAVLAIDPTGYALQAVKRGSIDDLRVGMRVAAIGNPFGFEGTLTSGIISGIGRTIPSRSRYSIPDSIQTDAPINPGNSGGPLINERGEVIGVNAQIRSEERANSGVGFAIPIAIVERVVPALIAEGVYKYSYIGVSGDTFNPICAEELGVEPTLRGALVINVLPRTPAARARLQAGEAHDSEYPTLCPETKGSDLITAINQQPVSSFDDILVYLTRYTSPGDTVQFSILRDGKAIEVDVTLSERPEN